MLEELLGGQMTQEEVDGYEANKDAPVSSVELLPIPEYREN